MKVLVLQSELGVLRGGGENFTRNLFTAFTERGHQAVAAFCANLNGEYSLPLPSGIEPIPIPGWWSMNLGQATLSLIGRCGPFEVPLWDRVREAVSWRTIRWHRGRFRRRIEREFADRWGDFDAVYVHSNTILASRVAKYLPTVLRLPGPVGPELIPVLRSVPAVCANGDAFLRIRTFLGDHVTELPTGIDERTFIPGPSSVRSNLGWTREQFVVGYVGRLIHLKDVNLLATAFRDLTCSMSDTRLLIVGSGEEERSIRTILAKQLANGMAHIEADVDHEQLAEWYRAMDILVMPSRYENFSNVLLEAMACGVPFLGSDTGGNRLLAQSGAGWLFEPECLSSLGVCLRNAITNRTELEARGNVGSRYVRNRYSWAASAERLEEILASQRRRETEPPAE